MAIDPICGMQVNEKTGLKIEHDGKTVYFCSAHCMNKYLAENKLEAPVACTSCTPGEPFYQNKIVLISCLIGVLYISAYYIPFLSKLQMLLGMYLQKIALPVLIGLALGGIIEWLVPREYISKILSQSKKRTIIFAVFTGFLMTACSHGILALAIQLHKKGASGPAVVAFLLASPWANMAITILLFGFFGWKAFVLILSAIIIAIITGWIFLFLEKKKWVESNPNTVDVDDNFSIRADIKARAKAVKFGLAPTINAIGKIWEGSISLANMVLWWILLGTLLSSIAGALIPEAWMKAYMGSSILGLFVTLAVATVMEICSEGTAPLAFELYRQTGAFGNVFVFLMAGVVTDYTEIGLLWSNVGWRTAVFMPLITVPQVVFLGWVFNGLF
ncbi:MAG: permease [Candidatus Margulisiibacteriota bacterium]|jgi:hypothetical protein